MDTNNRNLFLTIGLSVLILTLWQIFYVNPQIEAERQALVLVLRGAMPARQALESGAMRYQGPDAAFARFMGSFRSADRRP